MKHIIIYIAIILVFSSCEERFTQVVDFDLPPHEPKIVSYSFTEKNDARIKVAISQSTGANESASNTELSDVDINIEKNGQSVMDNFNLDYVVESTHYDDNFNQSKIKTYVYEAENTGIEDNGTYTLNVSAENLPSTSGTTVIPPKVIVNDLTFAKEGGIDNNGDKVDEITIEFNDPADQENYYFINARINNGFNNYNLWIDSNDPRLKSSRNTMDIGVNKRFENFIYFNDDNGFEGKTNRLKINAYVNISSSATDVFLDLEFYSIPEEMFYFIQSNSLYDPENTIFSEPVEITSNMENGFGMFSMYNLEVKTIKIQ